MLDLPRHELFAAAIQVTSLLRLGKWPKAVDNTQERVFQRTYKNWCPTGCSLPSAALHQGSDDPESNTSHFYYHQDSLAAFLSK